MKHYDSKYLNDTFTKMEKLKTFSISFFENMSGTIIDLGCGVGKDAISIANATDGQVVGIDHDPIMIKEAQFETADNLIFIQGDANALRFENNSVSGVRSERMFQHVKNQKDILHEIHRVLQPNGKFVVLETDWVGITLYTADVLTESKIRSYYSQTKVVNGLASRSLPNDIQSVGFQIKEFQVFPFVIDSLEQANTFFKLEEVMLEMFKLGVLGKKEFEEYHKKIISLDKENQLQITLTMLLYYCIKV